MNFDISKIAAIYIVLITIAWCVLFYRHLSLKSKNKCKYDLRDIRFEVEPLDDDTVVFNIYRGKLLYSTRVFEEEITGTKPFKIFIKWLESEE